MARDKEELRLRARSWALATLAAVAVAAAVASMLNASWPGSALLLAALVLPLLLPLKGLLQGDRRTYAWATLCLVPCFVYAITEAIANSPVRAIAAAILFAGFAHFVALVAYLRVTRSDRESQAAPTP